MLSMDQRRRAFFKYEKRIRELSGPEKIFEYFASVGDIKSGFEMTPSDMMRSIVPVYPPEGSDIVRAGALPGEPSAHIPQEDSALFRKFDVNDSGGISYDEWLLFEALLSIPTNDAEGERALVPELCQGCNMQHRREFISRSFPTIHTVYSRIDHDFFPLLRAVAFTLMDTDGNGTVDSTEFENLLSAIQARASRHHAAALRHSVADLNVARGGLVAAFFGADSKKTLSLPAFKKFLEELREEMVRLEFSFYDYAGRGHITGKDFAHSVVGSARLKHIDSYLDKVEELPGELAEAKVTLDQFRAFRKVWRHMHRLGVALDFKRSTTNGLTPAELLRVVNRVLGVTLTPETVEILFHLFSDGQGGLNTTWLLSVMDRHFETGMFSLLEGGAVEPQGQRSFLECMSKCTTR